MKLSNYTKGNQPNHLRYQASIPYPSDVLKVDDVLGNDQLRVEDIPLTLPGAALTPAARRFIVPLLCTRMVEYYDIIYGIQSETLHGSTLLYMPVSNL